MTECQCDGCDDKGDVCDRAHCDGCDDKGMYVTVSL